MSQEPETGAVTRETLPAGKPECPTCGSSGGFEVVPARGAVFAQGFAWRREDGLSSLVQVLEAAFDYRGDVTLSLEGGERLVGYVYHRDAHAPEPYLALMPQDGSPRRRISCGQVLSIEFTGRDTASGRSWETWVRTYEAKKAARERGEDVGDIGLFPDAGEESAGR
jgi:hypothetical protein